MSPTISYAQRYEDMHLLRCFDAQPAGFYIDVGAGHPVYDNVSFAFYLRGWSGITVEPNPWLAELSAAVRPRDRHVRSLVGRAPGEGTYYLVEHFHGLSTTIESNAQAAEREYGKRAKTMPVPVTTLAALCAGQTPAKIDFLKIDVEGAEADVLSGNDWRRFRPKVIVAEALAPLTMRPAWDDWESILTTHGYRFAFFDTLNRYYVAEEHAALGERLAAEAPSFDGVVGFGTFGKAGEDRTHPDHRLAGLLAAADPVRLPLLPAVEMAALLTRGVSDLERAADECDVALVHERLFGGQPTATWIAALELRRSATLRDVYAAVIAGEPFQAACGRISASHAW
jgi:FkbM family methyltransferase